MIARIAALACLVACVPSPRERSFGELRWQVAPTDLGIGPPAMALDPSGDVVVAGLGETGAVMKLSGQDGSPLWTTKLAVASDRSGLAMPHVAIDRDHNVLLTGYYAGSVDFGGTIATSMGNTAFVAKYSSQGRLMWVRDLGPNAQACGRGIGVASDGAVYITGGCDGTIALPGENVPCHQTFAARFDADGTPRWARDLDHWTQGGPFITVTSDDALIVITSDYEPAMAERFDAAGTTEWVSILSHTGTFEGIVAKRDGGFVATIADSTATVVAVDRAGYGEWTTGSVSGALGPIAVAPDGRIFAAAFAALEAYEPEGDELDIAPVPDAGGQRLGVVALAASSDSLAFLGVTQSSTRTIGIIDLP